MPPTQEMAREYFLEISTVDDSENFVAHFTANGWKVGGKAPMKDWKAAILTWVNRSGTRKYSPKDYMNMRKEDSNKIRSIEQKKMLAKYNPLLFQSFYGQEEFIKFLTQ
jgi:hypothetical protein